MALDDLQRDFRSNLTEAERLLSGDPENPLIKHLVNTLWPFQEAVLDEIADQAEALDEAVDQAGDMIQAETAGVFAALILINQRLVTELDKRLGPSEVELRGFLKRSIEECNNAAALLEEITIPPGGEDDDDDDDDVDGDDDDGDDDEGAANGNAQ